MPQSKPAVQRLTEVHEGQRADYFVLLTHKEQRESSNGNPFFKVTFRDPSRQITTRIWSESSLFGPCEHEWEPGQFYKIRGTWVQTPWGPQLDIDKIRTITPEDSADGFNPDDFVPRSRFDVDEMFAELVQLAEREIGDQSLSELVVRILRRHEADIRRIPAATHNHHAYLGGYLEHTRQVTRNAVFLADQYIAYYPDVAPRISKSLVVAGAILHDIGKLRELEARTEATTYSAEGRLLGHMVLGRDIVREVAPEVPDLDAQTLLLLDHIIAAHQGELEWGAIVEPATIECLIVHYADDLDAKVHMMVQALMQDTATGPLTGRDNRLRRTLFKGQTSG
jgi:3'-5' exoribonuclease